MSTVPGKAARFLRPLPGISCRFDPVTDASAQVKPDSPQLLEFVVLADSPQIAPPHLRSTDGNLHTSDLFEKQPDGSYLYRGRDDDWIKSYDSDRTDAKFVLVKCIAPAALKRTHYFLSPFAGLLKRRYTSRVAIWSRNAQ